MKEKCDCGHEEKCPEENYWRLRLLRGYDDAPFAARYQMCELLRGEVLRQQELAKAGRNELHAAYKPPEKLVQDATKICDRFMHLDKCTEESRIQKTLNIRSAVRNGVQEIYIAALKEEMDIKDPEPMQAVEDLESLPPELRTQGYYKEDNEGGFTDVKPLTVLRVDGCSIVAEIVRISFWIGEKGDGTTFHQINLVDRTSGYGFAKKRMSTVSMDYASNRENSDFARVEVLLKDVERYVQKLESE